MAIPSNPWKVIWANLPEPLQNRYYLTLVIFLFIMVFLDRHSLWTQWKLHKAQARLEEDCRFYQEKIREAKEEAEDFEKTREKYAREHYYMKRAGEEVFVIREAGE